VNVFAGNDTIAAINQPLHLMGTGAQIYTWSPGNFLNDPNTSDPIAILPENMTYYLTGQTSQGCFGYDTIYIKVYNGPDIYIPNAFTPDNNGHNDIFRPISPGIEILYYFTVYNRWGQLIFTTTEIGKGWDGNFNGNQQPIGTYVWMIKARTYNGNLIEKKGTVNLIR
jgi:gliding motility-associated-like protein